MSADGVKVKEGGSGQWYVSWDGGSVSFDGEGAETRAKQFAAQLRAADPADRKRPQGKCSLGQLCDRDRLHAGRLRDVPDEVLARVVLCAGHQEEARPAAKGSSTPVAGSSGSDAIPASPGGPEPVKGPGRRRKAVLP